VVKIEEIEAMAEFYRSAIELADSFNDSEAERFLNLFGADDDGHPKDTDVEHRCGR
jgi:hypothetical protein